MNDRTVGGGDGAGSSRMPLLVYALFLASTFVGLTAIIAVVIAHLRRDGSAHWQQSHYLYQIRSFWIALPIFFTGVALSGTLAGALLLAASVAWFLARNIKGLWRVSRGEAMEHPRTFFL